MQYGIFYDIGFVIAVVLLVLLVRVNNVKIVKYLLTMTVLVAFWILMEALSFYVKPEELILFFQKAKYLGVILVPPLFFLTSVIFTKTIEGVKGKFGLLLFLVPLLSLLSIISGVFPYKFMSQEHIFFLNGIPRFLYRKEAGFLINTFFSYGEIVTACYLLLLRTIKAPKMYHRQSSFIFGGCTTSIVINVLFITEVFGTLSIDTTPLCVLASLIFFYLGIFRMPRFGIVPYARDLMIENIKDMVIILDTSNCICRTIGFTAEIVQSKLRYWKGASPYLSQY